MVRAAPCKTKLTVVLVEDDPAARRFLKKTLEQQCGHRVVGEAATGREMVRQVLALKPDVVVFDIHLPELDGVEALQEIYQTRAVAAVVISGDPDQTLIRRATEADVLAYLLKPVQARHLGPALQVAWAHFEKLSNLANENASLRRTLQNRKIIERAKGTLMMRYCWSENDAFRRLQKEAMNRRVPMVQLAQAVLDGNAIELGPEETPTG
jgi:response regulator NasT